MIHPGTIAALLLSLLAAPGFAADPADSKTRWLDPYTGPARTDIDASTIHHKVMCGYQGWFRCPGDPAGQSWVHWSRNGRRIAPNTLSFEMWPDMSAYGEDEKYAAPGFTYPNGQPAHLFSSANPKTINRHFDWMRDYGIDGVFVQRFVVEVGDPASSSRVLGYARQAANRTGRVFAITYDMTGMRPQNLFERMTTDWKWLVDEMKITSDPRYLRENGKPVLHVYGFFSERFSPELANRIIDFFKNDPKYGVTLIGGTQWPWRNEKNPQWNQVFRRFDIISPWNVGNLAIRQGVKHANTSQWAPDMKQAQLAGMKYLPVVYPGFSWDNLMRKPAGTTNIPRRGGEFYWEQFATACDMGIDMVYVAMFDEVDEGTAIFKISDAPPKEAHFVGTEGKPSDWYLRLTGEASKMVRGEKKPAGVIPITPDGP